MNELPHVFRPASWRLARRSLFVALAWLGMSACQPTAPGPSAGAAPVVGADADAHGCKGSAAYVWSDVQQRCMRLFEEAFSFDPDVDNPDQTLKAFVVLGPGSSHPQKAELFLPQSPKALALEVVKTSQGDMRPIVLRNKAAHIEVVRVKDMYVLSIKGRVQFTHDAVTGSPLGKI
ncbi:MAG: hypothetical protein ACOYB1_13250 [Limnohabitans sp.]